MLSYNFAFTDRDQGFRPLSAGELYRQRLERSAPPMTAQPTLSSLTLDLPGPEELRPGGTRSSRTDSPA